MVMADSVEEKSSIEDDFRSTDVDMDEPLLSENRQRYKKGLSLRFVKFHVWCLAIQFVLLCIYIVSAIVFAKSWKFYHATSVTADISLYNDAPTTTEFVRFDRSAYQLPGEAKSPYEGFPTLANDAAWEELTNVGMADISAEERARLPSFLSTVEDVHRPGEYVVMLSVFHQLHCLKMIRNTIFKTPHVLDHLRDEPVQAQHLDHCIDYFRQVIQCHSDLTPLLFWRYNGQSYLPDLTEYHQCRKFDDVYAWAVTRNQTGTLVSKKVAQGEETSGSQ